MPEHLSYSNLFINAFLAGNSDIKHWGFCSNCMEFQQRNGDPHCLCNNVIQRERGGRRYVYCMGMKRRRIQYTRKC